MFSDLQESVMRWSRIPWTWKCTKEEMDTLNRETVEKAEREGKEVVVLLHGVFTSYYAGMYYMVKWFHERDICAVSIGYDYNQLCKTAGEEVGKKIDEMLAGRNIKSVSLVGVSMGGNVARFYVELFGGKDKIRRLVTVCAIPYVPKHPPMSFARLMRYISVGKAVEERSSADYELIEHSFSVKQLAIYSTGDGIVKPNRFKEGQVPESVTETPVHGGHLMLIFDDEVMEKTLAFLKDDTVL